MGWIRKASHFFVAIDEIEGNNFDLSISKYREFEYKEVTFEDPEVIKQKILELEKKIIETLQEIPTDKLFNAK